jgi:hypothetical protein
MLHRLWEGRSGADLDAATMHPASVINEAPQFNAAIVANSAMTTPTASSHPRTGPSRHITFRRGCFGTH